MLTLTRLLVVLWSITNASVLSDSTVTVPTETPSSCNSADCPCLPGIPGVPGIPAVPAPPGVMGPKGDPGAPGEKGNTGSKGDRGYTGAQGVRGLIGDTGRQGERGPRGFPGPQGEVGPTGFKGVCEMPQVAFTVGRVTRYTSSGGPLAFDKTIFNAGANFDLSNGTFTCSVPGVYSFSFSVLKTPESRDLYVSLVKNEETSVKVYENTSGFHQLSSGAVMALVPGDQVYLVLRGRVHGNEVSFTSFTGFLLYPN
ncbi:collagen alpha-1(X) chain-like [Acanthaster planci]|uniref:Collagen alpha-1(X) chain-like n=1 Tax=Acanthaster planci TaxID=133434 RepID=A0A8B7Z215_ACAPL|nr:collagen alpha-1(X) chain-like [Acanthaster planci]